jgi:hypothetical protein
MFSRPLIACVLIAALAGLVCGCDREKAPTTPEVQARYHALLDTLDADAPGAAVNYLGIFLREAAKYQVADSVQIEMNRFRAATEGRYHEARSLAREGEFDRAERMLEDLARLPDTPDGESAINHLKFQFYIEQAKWLLIHQRFAESKVVAQELLKRDLNRFQVDEVEQILDYTGHANSALEMTSLQDARNACRQLIVLLANVYINDGSYPTTLSISDLDRLDPYGSRSIASKLSSIEDYHASQDNYSLVAVGKGGQRFRIVDGQLEE